MVDAGIIDDRSYRAAHCAASRDVCPRSGLTDLPVLRHPAGIVLRRLVSVPPLDPPPAVAAVGGIELILVIPR
jgi:hypothetical protein